MQGYRVWLHAYGEHFMAAEKQVYANYRIVARERTSHVCGITEVTELLFGQNEHFTNASCGASFNKKRNRHLTHSVNGMSVAKKT